MRFLGPCLDQSLDVEPSPSVHSYPEMLTPPTGWCQRRWKGGPNVSRPCSYHQRGRFLALVAKLLITLVHDRQIGSVEGITVPGHETYAYSASKAGLHHLSRTMGGRLGWEGITSNTIACGQYFSLLVYFSFVPSLDLTMGESFRTILE